MFNLTENETKVLIILTKTCLRGMGGDRPSDLEHDEYTWINPEDLKKEGYTPKQCSGFFSSLMQKGLIYDYDNNEWVLATQAWQHVDTIWDERKESM